MARTLNKVKPLFSQVGGNLGLEQPEHQQQMEVLARQIITKKRELRISAERNAEWDAEPLAGAIIYIVGRQNAKPLCVEEVATGIRAGNPFFSLVSLAVKRIQENLGVGVQPTSTAEYILPAVAKLHLDNEVKQPLETLAETISRVIGDRVMLAEGKQQAGVAIASVLLAAESLNMKLTSAQQSPMLPVMVSEQTIKQQLIELKLAIIDHVEDTFAPDIAIWSSQNVERMLADIEAELNTHTGATASAEHSPLCSVKVESSTRQRRHQKLLNAKLRLEATAQGWPFLQKILANRELAMARSTASAVNACRPAGKQLGKRKWEQCAEKTKEKESDEPRKRLNHQQREQAAYKTLDEEDLQMIQGILDGIPDPLLVEGMFTPALDL